MSFQRPGLWTVVACGAAILSLAIGCRQAMGLFLPPMTLDIGVGREVFGFAMAVSNIMWGIVAPFGGALADRYGTGRVVAAGGLLYALGLVVMGFANSGADLILGSFLIGTGLAGAGFSGVMGAVGRAAPAEKRGMALGIVAAGGSFGQFAIVPYSEALISGFGWAAALLYLAATAAIMVPLARGVAGYQASAAAQGSQSMGAALREAMAHRGFVLLTAGFFVCGFQVVFVGTHLPAYLADKSMPSWLAAWALALVGLFNIIGSFGSGMLGDRFRKKYVLSLIYFLRSVVFLVFLAMPLTETSTLIFAAALGLLWLGTVPLTSGLVAQIFGPTYMSMLYGIVFLSHQVGSFFGAWLGGWMFDRLGSYDAMWWISVALGLIAAALHYPIPDRPIQRPVLAGAAA
jgi:MFS family permease